jgi:hypothetical protein
MAARRNKSKKQSGGSEHSQSPPEDFTLYLDENLCNATAILDVLKMRGIRFEPHLAHFERGVPDEEWLPVVGERRWVLLTADKRIRYNLLEKRALKEYSIREFVFASGNMSGSEMAAALDKALPRMRRTCRKFQPPFVAAITRNGDVHMRWPR